MSAELCDVLLPPASLHTWDVPVSTWILGGEFELHGGKEVRTRGEDEGGSAVFALDQPLRVSACFYDLFRNPGASTVHKRTSSKRVCKEIVSVDVGGHRYVTVHLLY